MLASDLLPVNILITVGINISFPKIKKTDAILEGIDKSLNNSTNIIPFFFIQFLRCSFLIKDPDDIYNDCFVH